MKFPNMNSSTGKWLVLALVAAAAGALWAQVPPPPPSEIFDPTEEIRADSIISLPADI